MAKRAISLDGVAPTKAPGEPQEIEDAPSASPETGWPEAPAAPQDPDWWNASLSASSSVSWSSSPSPSASMSPSASISPSPSEEDPLDFNDYDNIED